MTRRGIGSMPVGTVIAALVAIALVVLAALFLFGGSSEGAPTVSVAGPAQTGP